MSKQSSGRVVVTGYGALCALGNSVDEIWTSIENYKVGYRRVEYPGAPIVAKFFGVMDNKPPRKPFSKAILKFLPEFAKLGLSAATGVFW